MVDLLQDRRLTYFGHVNRMGNDRFPKMLLHGHIHGHRSRENQKEVARQYSRGLRGYEYVNTSIISSYLGLE